ncbi:MAG: type II toxin-antitoxin system RelE/ParE family toxin [Lachnospiraceae bacterium]|nr:type II toxin-antitoxin system RelE/ParE family toxin [Lachnospiraceae bacterium]
MGCDFPTKTNFFLAKPKTIFFKIWNGRRHIFPFLLLRENKWRRLFQIYHQIKQIKIDKKQNQGKVTIDNTINLLYDEGKSRKMMNRTFKETTSFTRKWHSLGLTEDDLIVLQGNLLKDPKTGDVIRQTGGIRKIRIPIGDEGKRSGGRVIYVDIELKECIYLLDVYAKNEQTDLSDKERKLLAKLLDRLREE